MNYSTYVYLSHTINVRYYSYYYDDNVNINRNNDDYYKDCPY